MAWVLFAVAVVVAVCLLFLCSNDVLTLNFLTLQAFFQTNI